MDGTTSGETSVCDSPRTVEECANTEPRSATVDTYFHAHPGLPPLRSYAVTCIDSIVARHEGRGLVLDTVLEYETRGVADRDDRQAAECFYDVAIWEGDRVVAVLRRSGNAVETIRLAPAPADGE
jgi:hypothetical protein